MNVQTTFVVRLQLANHVLYGHSWRGYDAVDRDVLQPPKTHYRCQRRNHVPEKVDQYNTTTRTTNQAATCVQSPTTLAEYRVVALQVQISDLFFRYKYSRLDPKRGQAVSWSPEALFSTISFAFIYSLQLTPFSLNIYHATTNFGIWVYLASTTLVPPPFFLVVNTVS